MAHIALARVLIAQNKLREARDLLSSLEEITRLKGRQGRLIEIMLLKALALRAMGDTIQANATFLENLALAKPEGYMRIFLDEGEIMAKFLLQLSVTSLSASNREYVDRLLMAFALKENIMV